MQESKVAAVFCEGAFGNAACKAILFWALGYAGPDTGQHLIAAALRLLFGLTPEAQGQ